MVVLGLETLEVRLAESAAEIEAAQALRYRVFYEELAARPTPLMKRRARDVDKFDAYCDHLVVIDHAPVDGKPRVVGTYRLMRRSVATAHEGFYSAQEYDLAPLLLFPGEVTEVGRSCVHRDYRQGAVMQLLWRGISKYLSAFNVEILFGCGSFTGTDPTRFAVALSYLYHRRLAPESFRPRALSHRYVDMRFLPRAVVGDDIGMAALPPLLKGYMRLGGFVGDGAVIDRQFNTVDVCVLVKTDRLTGKYRRHYRPSGVAPMKRLH
ncbi:MAG: GNAT family N-acetyltransferase [Rhodospirillales bacterium]